ncbi:MAG: tetratricopeptide repeat protein [Candidatus Latescibacteria bacterium]|nr:tetratricopeptide repeat protein [Candidatus Latescibacterota bacterium]
MATALAYHNSLANPFFFDDIPSIVDNADIRTLWPLAWLDSAWHGSLSSRPLVMFSFTLNYVLAGGADAPAFRLVNILLHLACGTMLYLYVERLLRAPALVDRFGAAATPLALLSALLWLLHPLQSQCINYIVQRSESLMALCCLTALYAALRALGGRSGWAVLAAGACLLGMGSKESMVGAPLLIALSDRAACGDRAIWVRRWKLYAALAATWLALWWLLADRPHRTTIGFDQGISAWTYALNQCQVLVGYLRLFSWPDPLVFDYGYPDPNLALAAIWPQTLILLSLLAGTLWLICRHPAAGLAAAAFFILLAPTSSFVPLVKEVAAERRLYLPLAALIPLLLCTAHATLSRRRNALRLGFAAALGAVLACGLLTSARNRDYRNGLALWRTAAAAVPHNPRAHIYLALELAAHGDLAGARDHNLRAIEIVPQHPDAHNNLGIVLAALGHTAEAIDHYRRAIAGKPGYFEAHNNLGIALATLGHTAEAIDHYHRAIELKPGDAKAHSNLGIALVNAGRREEAGQHFLRAIALAPTYARPHNRLGIILEERGDLAGALRHYRRAIELAPDFADAHNNLGIALEATGEHQQAIAHYRRAIAIDAENFSAHYNLGLALRSVGRPAEAVAHFRRALALAPDSDAARSNLQAAVAEASVP